MERASIPKSECLPLRCSLESEDWTWKDVGEGGRHVGGQASVYHCAARPLVT